MNPKGHKRYEKGLKADILEQQYLFIAEEVYPNLGVPPSPLKGKNYGKNKLTEKILWKVFDGFPLQAF